MICCMDTKIVFAVSFWLVPREWNCHRRLTCALLLPSLNSNVDFGTNPISVGRRRRCEFAGCTKWPLYAFEGEKAKYCSQHKVSSCLVNMESVDE